MEAKYRLGLFDDPYRYSDPTRPGKDILSEENRKMAREIAARSFVLLKNHNEQLPLKKDARVPSRSVRRIHVPLKFINTFNA